jgi:hypothetical protein
MDMNNKHTAVISVGVLVLVFLGFVVWYMTTHQAPSVFAPGTATSTTQMPAAAAGPGSINENAAYYIISGSYPGSTPRIASAGAEADAAAVSMMKSFLLQEVERFKSNGNFANLSHEDVQIMGLDQRKYTFDVTWKTYQGAHTLSYVFQLTQDTGGAHPNTYYKTFTFDTTGGERLDIGDIFQPNSNYLQLLSTKARADLPALINKVQEGAADTETINVGTQPITDDFQSWYINDSNLVLLFAPYQVGPYSLGTILDTIPLPTFATVLKNAYQK